MKADDFRSRLHRLPAILLCLAVTVELADLTAADLKTIEKPAKAAAPPPAKAAPPDRPQRPRKAEQPKRKIESLLDRFDEAWDLTAQHFYDKNLRASRLDRSVFDAYRKRAAEARSLDDLAVVLNEMLALLKTSHCAYFPNTRREYYEVSAIFNESFGRDDSGTLRLPTVGAVCRKLDGAWFVSAVLKQREKNDDEPLLVGDRIETVDGQPFDPIVALRDRVGKRVMLRVEREKGKFIEVRRAVRLVHPVAPYIEDMIAGVRTIDHAGLKIGYCRIWWMGRMETFGATFHCLVQISNADAVIVDLRDGWGGNPFPYWKLFDRAAAFTVCNKPAAVLINGGTRSAKEVVSFEFRRSKRGILVGEKTAGAVMPSAGFPVGPDGVLVLAVGKMGDENYAKIEGPGVEPDIKDPFDIRFAAGKDPQLDRALREVAGRIPPVTLEFLRRAGPADDAIGPFDPAKQAYRLKIDDIARFAIKQVTDVRHRPVVFEITGMLDRPEGPLRLRIDGREHLLFHENYDRSRFRIRRAGGITTIEFLDPGKSLLKPGAVFEYIDFYRV